MPSPKRWSAISRDLNLDDEVWELTDEFGDRTIRLWLEILFILDRLDNHWIPAGDWVAGLSRKVRQQPSRVREAILWMVKKGWIVSEGTAENGLPLSLRARNYFKYHRSSERKGSEVGALPGSSAGTNGARQSIPSLPNLPNTTLQKEKPERKTFLSDSVEVRLSQLLFDLIRVRLPEAKAPNFQTWAKSVDLMIRQDHRTPEQIEAVIRFAHADPFWQSNILSTAKLREKFDQLLLRQQGSQRPSSSHRPAKASGFSPTAAALNAARQAEVAGQ